MKTFEEDFYNLCNLEGEISEVEIFKLVNKYLISKQKVNEAIDNMKFPKLIGYFEVDEKLTKMSLKKELELE